MSVKNVVHRTVKPPIAVWNVQLWHMLETGSTKSESSIHIMVDLIQKMEGNLNDYSSENIYTEIMYGNAEN